MMDIETLRQYCLWAMLAYFIVISVVSVVMCALDKNRAKTKKNDRRIPEAVLMMLAALGGGVCMFLTMLLIRHKTRHIKFMLGIPCIILLHSVLLFLILT